VAQEIIRGLHVQLTRAEAERMGRDVPRDMAAYEYYLRGVDLYSADLLQSAISALEKSVAIDPTYAPAWAYLGAAYTTVATLQFGGREAYGKAQSAYEQALKLNPEQIEARIFMAGLLTDTNRVEQAVPLLRGVLATNQNLAQAHWELQYAYRYGGMLDEAIAEGERARQLESEIRSNNSVFNSYLYAGQYEKFLKSLPVRQESAFINFYRGLGHYYLKNMSRAVDDFERAYELDPALLPAQIGRALSLSIKGQPGAGLNLLRETERKVTERGVSDAESIYKVAQVYAVLGDKQSALRLLRRSINGGFFCYPYFVSDPLLTSLRDEAEYQTLMEMARDRHEEFKRKFF
jgi:tetratricopeptide (TPR) repeat protein